MPTMHFLHKTFPGTSNKIFHRAKFHSSSCLVTWLPKTRSFSLANWESTFFSQNLTLLNLSFTVQRLYTWLTHPKQLCGMPDILLVSLTGLWCSWQRGNNQTDLGETTPCSSLLEPYYTLSWRNKSIMTLFLGKPSADNRWGSSNLRGCTHRKITWTFM